MPFAACKTLEPGIPAIQLRNHRRLPRECVFKNPDDLIEGYPILLNKKTCARVVTYRQRAEQHLEKTPRLLKRKDFMKIFLSCHADYDGALRMSIRRADSDPCPSLVEGAVIFCGREANSRRHAILLHSRYGK
jgi:hypothetical protein